MLRTLMLFDIFAKKIKINIYRYTHINININIDGECVKTPLPNISFAPPIFFM